MAHNPPVDVQEIAGNVPSATNPLPVRLTDGAGFYVAGGGGGGGGGVVQQGAKDATAVAWAVEQPGAKTYSAAAIGNGVAIGPIDTAGYGGFVVVPEGTYTGSIAWEFSEDGTTWHPGYAVSPEDSLGLLRASTNTAFIHVGPVTGRYIRINVFGYSAGTINIFLTLTPTAPPFPVVKTTIANGQAAALGAMSGSPVHVAGRASTTTPTDPGSDGTVQWFWLDRVGRLHTIVDSGSVSVANFPATQPVSLATNTPDVTDRAARLLGHVTVDNASLAVTGPLTDTQLRATRVPVDPSGVTSPISAAALPLPAGAATEATLAAASAKLAGLGQKAMAASEAVVIASDQSAIPTKETPATLVGTTLGTANTAVTLTLNAVAAQFHYITSIEIVAINPTITAIAAAASNLAFTSTNLGGIAWNAGTLLAAGAEKVITRMQFGPPLRSQTVNTATTIVAPAIGAGGVVRITVTYYTAA